LKRPNALSLFATSLLIISGAAALIEPLVTVIP
jgi:hypothetical protein